MPGNIARNERIVRVLLGQAGAHLRLYAVCRQSAGILVLCLQFPDPAQGQGHPPGRARLFRHALRHRSRFDPGPWLHRRHDGAHHRGEPHPEPYQARALRRRRTPSSGSGLATSRRRIECRRTGNPSGFGPISLDHDRTFRHAVPEDERARQRLRRARRPRRPAAADAPTAVRASPTAKPASAATS